MKTSPAIFICVILIALVVVAFVVIRRRTDGDRVAVRVGQPSGGRVEKTDEQWRQELAPQVFEVTRRAGTERAFTGAYWNHHGDGEYTCACCGQKLFDSAAKYESGTGWPSYWKPIDDNAVSLFEDRDVFGVRTEVLCSRCDAHLGHVFDDGPPPTGRRYCMNSAALKFEERAKEAAN